MFKMSTLLMFNSFTKRILRAKKRKIAVPGIILLISVTLLGAYQNNTRKRNVPLMIITSSKKLTGDFSNLRAIALDSARSGQIKAMRGDAPEIMTMDQNHNLIGRTIQPLHSIHTLAISQNGNTILCDSDGVDVVDASGTQLKRITAHRASSAAPLSDENIVIASTDNYKPIHIYSKDGYWLRSIGEIKQLYAADPAENDFLNEGIVLSDSADNIYYIMRHATEPSVRKYNKDGEIVSEFPIKGDAIELQAARMREYLKDNNRSGVGGYEVVTSAALDTITGHLWIGLNGTNKTGIVYEYDTVGQKLGEYMLQSNDPSLGHDIITGIRGIAVKGHSLYAITWNGEAYQFEISTAKQIGKLDQKQMPDGNKGATRQQSKGVSSFLSNSFPSTRTIQLPCPIAQSLTCTSNCATGNPTDCGAEIQSRLSNNDRLIGPNTCTQNPSTPSNPGGCSASGTYCNTISGTRGTITTTRACPTCQPAGQPPQQNCTWNTSSCTWNCPNPQSPIVIDIAGNGFNLTNLEGGVRFDLNSDGVKERLSWSAAGSDDAWLALDRNGNGRIDNGKELFGNYTSQPPSGNPNGFLALAEFDKPQNGGNGDGTIDRRDSVYAILRLWQDRNHNGISEPGELYTLTEFELVGITLNYFESKRRDEHGNLFRYWSLILAAPNNAVGRRAYDIFLLSD